MNWIRIIGPALLTCASLATAESPAPTVRPNEYFAIAARKDGVESQAEVVEFFSYGCSHCADFQPYMTDLKTRLPVSTKVRLVPVVLNPQWEGLSRAFYAAESFGIVESTHQRLFERISGQRSSLPSLNELATQFYRQFGIDPGRFVARANSAAVTQKLGEAYRLAIAYGVDRTPTLAINGKYRIVINEAAGVSSSRVIDLAVDLLDK
jgi:thiol:disulfide interchange protein DsbA